MSRPELSLLNRRIADFRGRVQKVLPAVYDDSLSYYELLGKVMEHLNQNGQLTNDMVTLWNDVYKWLMGEGLNDSVQQSIDKIVATGQFDEMVEETFIELKQITRELAVSVSDFPRLAGETDDTARIQRAIDYAFAQTGEYDKKPRVNLGSYTYEVKGINVPRGIIVYGDAVLNVIGDNNYGVRLLNAVHSELRDFKINLTDKNQTGLDIPSIGATTETASQLNNISNVWIEGNMHENTKGVVFGATWVNTFTGCRVFRCSYGLVFTNDEANANFFYGCEVRHNNTSPYSNLAIHHMGGKNNMFIGGVIENYQSCIEQEAGDFKIIGCYTEAFAVNYPYVLKGGTLTVSDSLIKGKFEIHGGECLRVLNNDLNRGGVYTSDLAPLVRFTGDYNTKVILDGNDLPDSVIMGQWGMYYDAGSNSFVKRSSSKIREEYRDRKTFVTAQVTGLLENVTGDSTDYNIPFGTVIADSQNEFVGSTGVFTAKESGLFEISACVRIDGIDENHTLVKLFCKEGAGRSFMMDMQKAEGLDTLKSQIVHGSCTIRLDKGKTLRVSVKVDGTSKVVDINGGTDPNVWSYLNIKRLA